MPRVPVVQDRHLHGDVVLHGRAQFLDVHLDAAVSGDAEHGLFGVRHLGADGRREPVPHGAEAAGGEPHPRLLELIELGGPHLVLPHVGGDDGVAARYFIDLFDHELGLDDIIGVLVGQRALFAPRLDLLEPAFCGWRPRAP